MSNRFNLRRAAGPALLLPLLLAACSDPVSSKISSVTVTPAALNMNPGKTDKLTASVSGTGTYNSKVKWTSSNQAVATVSETGQVTAVAVGEATITATSVADSSKSGSAKITVTTIPGDGVKFNFQLASSTTPAGYIADTGAAYNPTTGYGWVTVSSLSQPSAEHQGADATLNVRDRKVAAFDARLNTTIHMQYQPGSVPGNPTPVAWEYAVPNGFYTVTVTVGDAGNNFDSVHHISAEGQTVVQGFTSTSTRHFYTTSTRVEVTDGRLTLSPEGGTNTKLVSVSVAPGERPSVRYPAPQDGEMMVDPTTSVTADLNLPNSAVDADSLKADAVKLVNVATGATVAAGLNTSGGGDVVVLKPQNPLASNTTYRFEINANLKDTTGQPFLPFESTFTTGSSTTSGTTVAFEQVSLQSTVPTKPYTSVEIGPDNKLYAATLSGEILRFGMNADGTLTAPQIIKSVQAANGGPRTIIGMKFDPASTADNLIMWISNNAMYTGQPTANWTGKITRLSGPDLGTVQDIVVGLPRSVRDHMTNSVSFRPGEPKALYILQGSQSAMGAPDNAWGNQSEQLLSGALLRLDLTKVGSTPLNVQTADGGNYNPYAPGAPLTLYATGIRNAFDMVWHTNGQLYVPTNGSAAGGNAPATPALPATCANGSTYTGPAVPALKSVTVQSDYLFRVQQGGYYGHPNPLRCEWVLNGGNPTAGTDPAEVTAYPVGTTPASNWRGYAYDFGLHASANGVIEEYTLNTNSALKNKLMVVRYSAGKDIVVLTPGGEKQDIVEDKPMITGLTNFTPSPLDLIENRANGYIYVAQLDEITGNGTITLVRPK